MLERLAYEAGLRALDKQEIALEELRRRTGLLLAAAALAASFLGESAFRDPPWLAAALALGAFLTTMVAALCILVPRANRFTFSLSGPALYTGLSPSETMSPNCIVGWPTTCSDSGTTTTCRSSHSSGPSVWRRSR